MQGQKVTIGVIGGSITGGAGASSWEKSYGPLVAEWWRQTFPQAHINFVNAGIGGTGSLYGAVRCARDLLVHKPDFVITEFAVNDGDDQTCREAFEGLTRLKSVRASLNPDEIVEPTKATISKTQIVDFPAGLELTEEASSLKAVHTLLSALENSSLGLRDTDAFAQQHKLENRKAHILRFIWILASYGKFERDTTSLVVDAETYYVNRAKEKTLSIWSFVEDVVFKVLAEYGICCERAALENVKIEDLTTGTGYLRKKGWLMRMSFKEKIGGIAALKAMHTYAKQLDKTFGSKAFNRFRQADMTLLLG